MVKSGLQSRAFKSAPSICVFYTHRAARPQRTLPIFQTRSISRSYLKKKEAAAEEWAKQAIEIKEGRKESMLTMMEKRGYINAIAGERDDLDKLMTQKRVGIYAGFDPTAASLHVGHLLPLMVLFWFYIKGFSSTSLLGGATAGIGDPSGRTESRPNLGRETKKLNTVTIHYQLKRIWQLAETHARNYGYHSESAWKRAMPNNNHWLNKLNFPEVLKLLGPGMRIGTMLGRDTVKKRLESGAGMSFSEFCYPILQAWDWWHMYHTNDVQIQVGGSDQYGNIIAGMDAVNYISTHHPDPLHRRKPHEEFSKKPMGFTVPLLTTSSGEKFGKSAGNAVWLDRDHTSCFDLYQYFLRTADADTERYLKLFTFLPLDEISSLMATHIEAPHKRKAQHKLAYEVLCLVHGAQEAKAAQAQHHAVFQNPTVANLLAAAAPSSGSLPQSYGPLPGSSGSHTPPNSLPTDISPSLNIWAPQANADTAPLGTTTIPLSLVQNQPIARVLYSAGLVSSRSEGHRLVRKGGAYVANKPDNKKSGISDQVDYVPIANWQPHETMDYMLKSDESSSSSSSMPEPSTSSTENTAEKDNAEEPTGSFIFRIGKWRVRIVRVIPDSLFIKQGLTCPGWSSSSSEDEEASSSSSSSSSTSSSKKPAPTPKHQFGKLSPLPTPDPQIAQTQRQEQSARDAEIAFAARRSQEWLGPSSPVSSSTPLSSAAEIPKSSSSFLRTPEARREEQLGNRRARRAVMQMIQEQHLEKKERLRPGKESAREERKRERRMRTVRAFEARLQREDEGGFGTRGFNDKNEEGEFRRRNGGSGFYDEEELREERSYVHRSRRSITGDDAERRHSSDRDRDQGRDADWSPGANSRAARARGGERGRTGFGPGTAARSNGFSGAGGERRGVQRTWDRKDTRNLGGGGRSIS